MDSICSWPVWFTWRIILRTLGIVFIANVFFFALTVLVVSDPDGVARRVQYAFETGELGLNDYLPFDTHRGFHQYNDCNILQMLSNPDPSRLKRALAPKIYKFDEDFNEACSVLYALVMDGVDRDTLLNFRYGRYWHGYNVPTALLLRVMDLRDLRRVLLGSVWSAIALLALTSYRSGRRVRLLGLTIAVTAATVWGVPYFSQGITHGPGDALLLLALVGIVVYPRRATHLSRLAPYSAGVGATVVFFEALTGQLPIAAAWLTALTFAIVQDQASPGRANAAVTALVSLIAFALGAVVTVAVAQILAFTLAEPASGTQFLVQIQQYTSVPASRDGWPGILRPFVSLVKQSSALTFDNSWVGYVLIGAAGLAWLAALVWGWRRRHSATGREILFLVTTALIPVAWVLLLPQHTLIHAPFIVRILVVPISLGPVALFWPRWIDLPDHAQQARIRTS